MSTRGTIGVRYDGQDKLIYNHGGSYPDGLGDKTYRDIKVAIEQHQTNGGTLDALIGRWREQAIAARLIDRDSEPTEAEKQRCRDLDLVDLRVSDRSENDWYCLLRNAQGKLLKLLEVGLFLNGNNFILDSLFCEWGYILNLDTVELEVYKGFQKQPHQEGRYAGITTKVEEYEQRNQKRKARYEDTHPVDLYVYYPCALIATIAIREFPQHDSLTDYLEKTGVVKQVEE